MLDLKGDGAAVRAIVWTIWALLATVVLHYIRRGYQVRSIFKSMAKEGIPIMKHSWFFGHLEIVGNLMKSIPKDAHSDYLTVAIMENWRELFPDCKHRPPIAYMDMWPFASPLAIPLNVNISTQFTQDQSLPKARQQKRAMYPLSKNKDLPSMEGPEWKYWRKSLNPAFSPQTITNRTPELVDEIQKFTNTLKSRAPTGASKGKWGDIFPLEAETMKLSFDITFRFFFGQDAVTGDGPLQGKLKTKMVRAILESITDMFFYLHIGNILAYISPLRHYRVWRNYRALTNGLAPVLHQQRAALKDQRTASTNMTLVEAIARAFEEDETPPSVHLSDIKDRTSARQFLEMSVGQIGAFLFAGNDTTASAICWCLHALSQNPDVLTKMRAEHDAVLGPDPTRAADTLRSSPHLLNSLVYTNAAIKESMRLHTNIGTLRRGAPNFFLVGPKGSGPYEGMRFPAGEEFVLWDANYALHKDPELWPRVDEFIPERYLVGEEDELHAPRDGWRFFAMGPRHCIGQHLAMTEIKIVLALLVREVELECAWPDNKGENLKAPRYKGDRLYQVGQSSPPRPKDGMPCHVRLR